MDEQEWRAAARSRPGYATYRGYEPVNGKPASGQQQQPECGATFVDGGGRGGRICGRRAGHGGQHALAEPRTADRVWRRYAIGAACAELVGHGRDDLAGEVRNLLADRDDTAAAHEAAERSADWWQTEAFRLQRQRNVAASRVLSVGPDPGTVAELEARAREALEQALEQGHPLLVLPPAAEVEEIEQRGCLVEALPGGGTVIFQRERWWHRWFWDVDAPCSGGADRVWAGGRAVTLWGARRRARRAASNAAQS